MPFLDGISMSRMIREITPKIPIIITTAFDNKEVLIDAISIGINYYIVKPIKTDNLKETLDIVANSLVYEKEYKKQEEKIRLLYSAIEHSSGVVIIFDSEGKIVYHNPQLNELIGINNGFVIDELNIFYGVTFISDKFK
jgi:YesN/AraC family two-component response regulator